MTDSYQPVLRGEERVHVGGFGGGDAAADGAEPPSHAAHAYSHPVAHHVSPAGRLRHEHPVPPHRQAGQRQAPAKYSVSTLTILPDFQSNLFFLLFWMIIF